MGQVIRFPLIQARYPDDAAALDRAECVLLTAIRWWVADFRVDGDPLPRLCETMADAGAHDAAFPVDQLMAVLVHAARRPIEIHCPSCPTLSGDEKHLLLAASLVQAGDSQMAERALRVALLSGQGAELALGPLRGIGELFGEVMLVLRRRESDPDEQFDPGIISSPPQALR